MPFTSVLADRDTPVIFDWTNVAVSAPPSGIVIGTQLLAVFQSPETGAADHDALSAWMVWMLSRKTTVSRLCLITGGRMPQGRAALVFGLCLFMGRRFRSVYKWVPVCGAGRGRLLRSISAAFAAALPGTGVDPGLTFTEFRSAFAGGLGGRL